MQELQTNSSSIGSSGRGIRIMIIFLVTEAHFFLDNNYIYLEVVIVTIYICILFKSIAATLRKTTNQEILH